MQVQQCDKNHFPQYALRKNLSCAGTSPQRAWHSTAGRQSSHRIVRARSARRESDSHKRAAAHERRRLAYDGGSFAFPLDRRGAGCNASVFPERTGRGQACGRGHIPPACSGWVLLFHQQRISQTSTRLPTALQTLQKKSSGRKAFMPAQRLECHRCHWARL
jgi:hypothetical protein